MATPGGFEPPISTVTGWHVCPLHHGASVVRQDFYLARVYQRVTQCVKLVSVCNINKAVLYVFSVVCYNT